MDAAQMRPQRRRRLVAAATAVPPRVQRQCLLWAMSCWATILTLAAMTAAVPVPRPTPWATAQQRP
eukprot:12532209-Alexandrium_andersonii.AAC.1